MKERSALIVLDIQNGLLGSIDGADALIRRVNTLIDAYHEAGWPVCFVRHTSNSLKEDSHEWQIAADLHKQSADKTVNKRRGNAFREQDMRSFIRDEGICIAVITGLMTQCCIQKTCQGALLQRLGTVLIADAHGSDAKDPQKVIERWNSALGRKGAAVITAEALLNELTKETCSNNRLHVH